MSFNRKMRMILVLVILFLVLCPIGRIWAANSRVLYIYDDSWHYQPTGWMAWPEENVSALSLDTAYPYGAAEGSFCTRMSYDPDAVWWAGFFAQAKGAWRSGITETPKGIDLSGYTAVKVQARAEADVIGAIKVQFGIGETGDSCGTFRTDWLNLTTEWQTFTIDISSTTNMTDVNGLFMVVMKDYGNVYPLIYIDDIKFVGPGPAAINDLIVGLGSAPGSVNLQWTAPIGDYTNTSYVVKYSANYISNQIDFNNATTYSQSWTPGIPGIIESHAITGLTPGQSYYFVIETIDSEGNQSNLSNIYYALARTAALGVFVNGTVDLGTMSAGAIKSGGPITITNIGGVPMTASLSVTNPAGWSADTKNTAKNHYILLSAFGSSEGAVSWNVAAQALSTIAVKSTATRFAGDQTGVNIPVDAVRKLYIQFTAPLSLDSGTFQQEMVVNVTAETVD